MVVTSSADRKRVVMTGFSPFQGAEINPSWEGVKFMDGREIENKYNITLFRKEIGVKYKEVDKIVPQMWDYYQPYLTIHVGLNAEVDRFVLEKMAKNKGYCENLDNDGKYPDGFRNPCDGPDVLSTTLDVDKICSKFNDCKRMLRDPRLRADSSVDAKRFLCEYIYYTSLYKGRSTRGTTLFVHVPPVYTSEQLAYGLERILELCLEQLSEDDYYSYDVDNDIDYKL